MHAPAMGSSSLAAYVSFQRHSTASQAGGIISLRSGMWLTCSSMLYLSCKHMRSMSYRQLDRAARAPSLP